MEKTQLVCAQCKLDFTPKNKRSNSTGNYFCSRECVLDAQRPGQVLYNLRKERSILKWGTQFPMSCDKIKNKRAENNLKKHGVENTFELESVKEKSKKTCKERFNCEYFSQTESFREKIKETNRKKFGFDSPTENPEILEKRRKTNKERWGGFSTHDSPILKERAQKTCIEKFGVNTVFKCDLWVLKSMNKKMQKAYGKSWKEYIEDLPKIRDYYREVHSITKKQPKETLENFDKKGEYHLDHKFSVIEGFRNNIPPEIIGNIVNLEFIPAELNLRKNANCSISKEQLFSLYYDNKKKEVKMNRMKMYLASGWFNEVQEQELSRLEKIMEDRSSWIDMASPRRIFICPPNATREVQDETYHGNLKHIRESDFLVVNTRDKDLGTIMECGYATAFNKHIIYFCGGLPAGAKFNLMLSRSGIKVCTTFEELEDYLDRCKAAGEMLYEPYERDIE